MSLIYLLKKKREKEFLSQGNYNFGIMSPIPSQIFQFPFLFILKKFYRNIKEKLLIGSQTRIIQLWYYAIQIGNNKLC